jgi:protein phosphatase
MIAYGECITGILHENEDNILIDNKRHLYAIADGVTTSSLGKGSIASKKAVKYLSKLFDGNLKRTIEKVNRKICEDKTTNKKIGETTLTAVYFNGNFLECCWVGDSLAFLVRNDKLMKIAKKYKPVQALGYKKVNIRSTNVKIKKGDYVILTSDGITDVLNEDEILNIVKVGKKPKLIVKKLIEESTKKPKAYDDKSAIVVLVE